MKDHPFLEFEIHDADAGHFYHGGGSKAQLKSAIRIDSGDEVFILRICPGCGESILHEFEVYEKMMANTPTQSLIRLGYCSRCRIVKTQLRRIERETQRKRDTLR